MILTYKDYTIYGTAQELKEFIDILESKTVTTNNLQGLTLENNIPSGNIHIFDPNTGTYVEGKIRNVPDGVTNKCNYPNNVCENH